MKQKYWLFALAFIALLVFAGCAAGNPRWSIEHPAGFWAGLWHGIIMIITFIISLFDKNVKIYEVVNNGGWYDFGFLLGILLTWGGGGAASRASCKRRNREGSS